MTRLEELQQKLRDNQAALQDIDAKRDASGQLPPDVRATVEKIHADFSAIKAEAEAEQRLEGMKKDAALLEFHGRPSTTTTTAAPDERSATYESAFWKYQMRDRMEDNPLSTDERRLLETRGTSTQITTTDSLGGFLVPKSFSNELEVMMKWYANMMNCCRVWDDRASGGGPLYWPSHDDTAVTGNINTAANQAATRTVSDLTIGNILFGDWLIDSNIVKVSKSLIQDERVGLLQSILAEQIGIRIGRKANAMWTNGTGTNEGYGLTTSVTSSAGTSASATALTKSELVKFTNAIDYSYQQGPKFGYMMHQSVLGYLRTLDFSTDTTHIFVPGNLAQGEPDRLLGKPIYINNDLPAVTGATGLPVTATKHIYIGDFSKFVIRQIRDVSIDRNDYLYWDQLSVGFLGFMRTDSRLINANAIKSVLQA